MSAHGEIDVMQYQAAGAGGLVLMGQRPRRQEPAGYQLRVDGHLDERCSAWFGEIPLTHASDGTTRPPGFAPAQPDLPGPRGPSRNP